MEIDIKPYHDGFKTQIIKVWEDSVRATHHFLIESDITYYKEIVSNIDFNTFDVFCLTQNDSVLGFLGVNEKKIEMLFLSPKHIGKGMGKTLLNFAVHKLSATEVDVNEQNENAVKFYIKSGFSTVERLDKDSEGKDYPILRMKLNY